MTFRKSLLAGAALLALSLASVPAQAQVSTFIERTCGVGCVDPIGEEARARDNWNAMAAMGTTQWIGGQMSGTTIDASSLLAAARVAGTVELDNWLRTGQTSDPSIARLMANALQTVYGIDVSSITGIYPTSTGSGSGTSSGSASSNLDTMLSGILGSSGQVSNGLFGPGGGGNSGYCDPSVSQAQNAIAQKYVQNMQEIATSGEFGFSQNGGQAISSGQRSQNGYFGSSCLDKLMQGTRDMLFKPPQLGQLLSQLGTMFGGGSGGSGGSTSGCNAADSVLKQVTNSMPSGIFQGVGNGGFFPQMGFGAEDSGGAGNNLSTTSGFGLKQAIGLTSLAVGALNNSGGGSGSSAGLGSLFRR